jgi:hypothetical protein
MRTQTAPETPAPCCSAVVHAPVARSEDARDGLSGHITKVSLTDR